MFDICYYTCRMFHTCEDRQTKAYFFAPRGVERVEGEAEDVGGVLAGEQLRRGRLVVHPPELENFVRRIAVSFSWECKHESLTPQANCTQVQ